MLQLVLGNGLAMGAITAILLNILFHHVGGARPAPAPTDPAPIVQ